MDSNKQLDDFLIEVIEDLRKYREYLKRISEICSDIHKDGVYEWEYLKFLVDNSRKIAEKYGITHLFEDFLKRKYLELKDKIIETVFCNGGYILENGEIRKTDLNIWAREIIDKVGDYFDLPNIKEKFLKEYDYIEYKLSILEEKLMKQ